MLTKRVEFLTNRKMSCGHLNAPKNYKDLLKSYTSITRYSLLYRHKLSLKINKRGRELRAIYKVDNPEPEKEIAMTTDSQQQAVVSVAQQKKKALVASGMEKVVLGVEKLPTPRCTDCNDLMASARLSCCLECVYIGCKSHIQKHAQQLNHKFLVDFVELVIYCTDCGDYCYNSDFEVRLEKEKYNLSFISSRIREPYNSLNVYHPTWIPTFNEKQLIATKYTVSKCTGKFICWFRI